MKAVILFLCMSLSLFCHDVISYGDAIIDYIVFADAEFLEKLPGERGGSEQIDLKTFADLTRNYNTKCAGGSAPNTMKGLARFGHDCAVIGRIGNDRDGKEYANSLKELGIAPLFSPHETATGRVVCLISPEGHRTMRSCIGQLVGFDGFDVDPTLFDEAKLFHIEGYQIPNPKFLQKLIGIAKEKGLKISMDLGCHELVAAHKKTLIDIIEKDLDILFTNEDEARVLTGLKPEKACAELAKICPIVVVTMGEKGGYVCASGDPFHYQAIQAPLVDDTGAGDLFMAGFLDGFLKGEPLEVCAEKGAAVASKVIQVVGAELPEGDLDLQQTRIGNNHQIGVNAVSQNIANRIECGTGR